MPRRLRIGFPRSVLTADVGSLSVTGQAAALRRGKALVAGQGAHSVTGFPATFRKNYAVVAARGTYSQAGQAATLTQASGGASNITSSFVASRTGGTSFSGAAPLFVFFDASGTTSSDSAINSAANGGNWRNIKHAFDFGTSDSTWALTGNSKNTFDGASLTAKVFESAGTYTVNCTHRAAGTGNKAATPITITVSDPNVVYAGTATVCVNGTGSNDGLGPSGCLYVSSVSSLAANTRYLYKKGGTFSAPSISNSNIRVGSYGSGAKPIISSGVSIGGSNNVVADLDIRGYMWIQGSGASHSAFVRCDCTVATGPYLLGTYEPSGSSSSFEVQKYTCFFECTATDPRMNASLGIACYYGTTCYTAFLGCTMDASTQHTMRISNGYKTVLQNNWLKGTNTDGYGVCLKLHAYNGSGSFTTATNLWNESSSGFFATQKCVASNNIFGSTTCKKDWTVDATPQNDTGSQPEGVTEVIYENNTFYRGTSGSPTDCLMNGKNLTHRGNVSANSTLIFSDGTLINNVPSGWNGPYFSS